jgi:protein TonB
VPQPEIINARADPRRPLSQPPYPAELIRQNVEGAVIVEVYVQPDGRVGEARIVQSSGHEAFDTTTLNEAKRKWRLQPAMRDGTAVAQWYRTRVIFKLTSQ